MVMNFKHGAKKRFNNKTTRSKTIQTGISSEYTEMRRKLDSVTSSVKSLSRLIKNTRTVWTAVAKHQKDFAESLVASLPNDGLVRDHAREVEVLVRSVHPKFLDGDNGESPDNKLVRVLDAYLAQIDKLRKDYPVLETAYTEVLRYQRKVDKLEAKSKRKNEVLQRNMTKLNAAHSDYETKLNALLTRMRTEYDKNDAVFQCAHHAFWLANHRYTATLDGVTRNIRGESLVAQHPLLRVDVAGAPRLTPVPRMRSSVQVLEPAQNAEVLAIEPTPSAPMPAALDAKEEFQDALPGTQVVAPSAQTPAAGPEKALGPELPTEIPKPPQAAATAPPPPPPPPAPIAA